MIVEALMSPIFLLIHFIISFLPSNGGTTYALDGFLDLLKYGLYFFGKTIFIVAISNVMFWATVQFSWAIIEWVYCKIPGIK